MIRFVGRFNKNVLRQKEKPSKPNGFEGFVCDLR